MPCSALVRFMIKIYIKNSKLSLLMIAELMKSFTLTDTCALLLRT